MEHIAGAAASEDGSDGGVEIGVEGEMHRARRCRRWIAGLIGLGLLIAGCEAEDRSPTDSAVTGADLQNRPDDRSSVQAGSRQMSTATVAGDDVVLQPGVEDAARMFATELLASQTDLGDRSGNWERLWTLLADGGVQEDAIPLEVAPFWILAAANTDRLSGCPEDWGAFMRDVVAEFGARHPEGHPSDEFLDEALATLALWMFDYTNAEATSAAAEDACQQR